MPLLDDDQVVVIRFWQEPQEPAGSPPVQRWRARIKYVNSGQQFYAAGIDEALALVRSLLLPGKYQS